jgi:quinol monooxygenase YgiN
MTVLVIGSFRIPPQNMEKARPHLRDLVTATRQNDGCLAYDAAEDLLEPGLIRFSEAWPDADTLSRHGRAPHIAVWKKASADLGTHDRKFTVYDGLNPRPL